MSFIAPLAEKIFLPAEAFQILVTKMLKRTDVGYASLSPTLSGAPLVLRMLLTTGRSFKARLAGRGMGNPLVEEIYRSLPLPDFIWVCEFSQHDLFLKHHILGEVLWDATRNARERDGWIALHYPEMLLVDEGSAFNQPADVTIRLLEKSTSYPVYRSNLKEI